MLHSGRFTVLLDACVLYPAPLRDHLLSLAQKQLYKPKWSDKIQDEWIMNLLQQRGDLNANQLRQTERAMNDAFPDARVSGFEEIIEPLQLPDPGDNHVLAAAIRCKADVIVTTNLKDFPREYLSRYDIEPQHPDLFVSNLIALDPSSALEALIAQSSRLRNPPLSVLQVVDSIEKRDMTETARLYRRML